PPEPFERRIERVETRGCCSEAVVLVPQPVALLDPGKVEERLGEVVSLRSLTALDLLPRLGPVRQVVAEAEIARADRVEHPARPSLDRGRDQRRTPGLMRESTAETGVPVRSK